jgi:hypothetical protein
MLTFLSFRKYTLIIFLTNLIFMDILNSLDPGVGHGASIGEERGLLHKA